MSTHLFGWEIPLPPWAVWSGFLIVCVIGGFFVGHILQKILLHFTKRTSNRFDDILIISLAGPLKLTLGLIVALVAAKASGLPPELGIDPKALQDAVKVLAIALLFVGAMRFATRWIDKLAEDNRNLAHAAGILRPLLRILILLTGILVVLHEFDVNIAPILTGLGVGGVAVALALQTTLSNFFAGITLISDRQVKQGDFVRLEGGTEGWIQTVGWRSTLIHTRENLMVIVPNLKLSESVITNYHLPHSWIVVPIPIGVSYASDPDHVQRVVLEEVDTLSKETKIILSDPPASCRFNPGFGESSLDFTLRFTLDSYENLFEARDLVRKRVFARLRKEGIQIPFPQRDLHIKEQPKA